MKEFLTLSEAAKVIPGRPHRNTIARWMHKGARGRKLKFWRIGSKIVTTESAIRQFMGVSEPAEKAATSPSHQAAERKLDAMGV